MRSITYQERWPHGLSARVRLHVRQIRSDPIESSHQRRVHSSFLKPARPLCCSPIKGQEPDEAG
jgi:hypothetical protein